MKIPVLAIAFLIAAEQAVIRPSMAFVPSLSGASRLPSTSLGVSMARSPPKKAPLTAAATLTAPTATTTTTTAKPPTPLMPELGKDGIYRILNKEQHNAFLKANQDQLVIVKFYAPWCKACKALGPKFQMIANDKKYAPFPVKFAQLSIVDNKDFVKALGVLALPSVQFYAGTDGLVENFPCGPSKVGILKRKLAQLIKERVDPETLGLKVPRVDEVQESEPCAERTILEETSTETELFVAGVKVSDEEMDFLRNGVPFFKDLSEEEFLRLMGRARLLSFDPGNVIMREGKRGKTFYVIQSGEVEVCAHTSFEDPLTTPSSYLGAVINTLSTRDYFGERALITGEKRAASIRAVEKTRCFAFDVADVPASSVLSGKGSPSKDRMKILNKKYGVDVHDTEVLELVTRSQLLSAQLNSQIRGSVNTPLPIAGVDFEEEETEKDVATSLDDDDEEEDSKAIIPLLMKFRLIRHVTRCWDYLVQTRPKWGDLGTRRRRSLVKMLTDAQREEFKEVFALIDASGDGMISLLELKKVMDTVGETKSEDELRDYVSTGRQELNGEKVITLEDFMGIMAEAEFYTLFRDTFKTLDTTDTGFVKAHELERVLSGVQNLVGGDRTAILNVDDEDVLIDYEQFSRMLLGTTAL